MAMIPSNIAEFLDQSGRFRADSPQEPIVIPIAPPSAPALESRGANLGQRRMKRGGPSERVMCTLQTLGVSMSLPDLVRETGLVKDSCVSALRHLCDTDNVRRSGKIGTYKYTLIRRET